MPANALSTDLYELTMMAGYHHRGRHDVRATFELFVRRLPRNRTFLVAAGLADVIEYIEALSFQSDQIEWLRGQPAFARVPDAFFEYLRTLRFTGDVWAMREGTPFFPNEPVLRVTAPLAEAQLLETAVLATVNFQTSVASKAVRSVEAARGRTVMEFGARRAHGPSAALRAARAAYLAGCDGTSYVEAGRRFGIPLSGTMAHSWILAARDEMEAFEQYTDLFGPGSILLIDTFDVRAAAKAIAASALRPAAVRLDSGNLLAHSRDVRAILDDAGLQRTRIFVSGDLDEWRIDDLVAEGAPIDGFGVGTALTTSEDAPALGGVYKLVQLEEDGVARTVMKRSEGKATWPGRKQVWRIVESGRAVRDVVALEADDPPAHGAPLLELMMRGGKRTAAPLALSELRTRCREHVATLPASLREVESVPSYAVERSERLQDLMADGRW
jgi:nicotinate phosphoribosyltransferase